MRPSVLAGQPLHLRAPAEPHSLAPLRQVLRRWLRATGIDEPAAYQVLVACGEACSNAIQHAYGAAEGSLDVDLALEGEELCLTVRDSGSWRTLSPGGGGRGLDLMRFYSADKPPAYSALWSSCRDISQSIIQAATIDDPDLYYLTPTFDF